FKQNQFADFTVTAGKSQQSFALSYVYNWQIGSKKKWELGVGLRNTLYTGVKNEYITAGPARLTRSFTIPFAVFFAGQREENFDTLEVQRPLINLLNVTANIGYNISPKWYAGFNIDVIGFSFGRKSSAALASKGINYTEPSAKPSSFNLLLTGDYDKGSLNSEFFIRYRLNKRWSLKGVYQFLFEEYQTNKFKQVADDGTVINRFRNKANNFGIGTSYDFK
ncbi:MAG: hypothetical protein ACM3H8_07850, partial [Sphingobacteriales bacterium]